jgi:hypothetical protein
VLRDEPPQHGARARHRDLLADDRPDGQLEAVDRAGHAQARPAPDQLPEQRVPPEHGAHLARVRVEVEQAAAASGGAVRVGQVVELELAADPGRANRDRDQAAPALEPEAATIGAGSDLLDTRNRPRPKERQKRLTVERLDGRQQDRSAGHGR